MSWCTFLLPSSSSLLMLLLFYFAVCCCRLLLLLFNVFVACRRGDNYAETSLFDDLRNAQCPLKHLKGPYPVKISKFYYVDSYYIVALSLGRRHRICKTKTVTFNFVSFVLRTFFVFFFLCQVLCFINFLSSTRSKSRHLPLYTCTSKLDEKILNTKREQDIWG